MRANPVIDLHLLLEREQKILLSLRAATGYEDGNYSLVAGHLEANETLTQGLCREAAEEVGIHVDEQHLALVHVMHHRSDSDRLAFFFKCNIWRGVVSNLEPHKCAGLKWVSYEQAALIDNQVGYVREAIRHIRSGQFYSSFGDWNVHSTGS